MRLRGRIDANQREIVAVLRAYGATVESLANIGGGCPDLLVGWRDKTYLIEVKDGKKPLSAQQLTPDEEGWIERWTGGPVTILSSVRATEHFLRGCV